MFKKFEVFFDQKTYVVAGIIGADKSGVRAVLFEIHLNGVAAGTTALTSSSIAEALRYCHVDDDQFLEAMKTRFLEENLISRALTAQRRT